MVRGCDCGGSDGPDVPVQDSPALNALLAERQRLVESLNQSEDRYLDFELRKEALDRVQVELARQHRSLPLYFNVVPELVSTRIEGHRGSGTNFGSFWNLWEWRLR